MTLVEIIIAMAVLAIDGSVMCTACSMVAKMQITTNSLNKRVSYESPVADCKIAEVKTYDASGTEVVTKYATTPSNSSTETFENITDDAGNVIKKVKYNSSLVVTDDSSHTYTVNGYLYQANYNGLDYGDGVVNTSNHNFKFFVIGGVDAS
jgi:hypothetical protein